MDQEQIQPPTLRVKMVQNDDCKPLHLHLTTSSRVPVPAGPGPGDVMISFSKLSLPFASLFEADLQSIKYGLE